MIYKFDRLTILILLPVPAVTSGMSQASATLENYLNLMVWSFLLGPWGGILAIPLTLALRRFVRRFSQQEEFGETALGRSI